MIDSANEEISTKFVQTIELQWPHPLCSCVGLFLFIRAVNQLQAKWVLWEHCSRLQWAAVRPRKDRVTTEAIHVRRVYCPTLETGGQLTRTDDRLVGRRRRWRRNTSGVRVSWTKAAPTHRRTDGRTHQWWIIGNYLSSRGI